GAGRGDGRESRTGGRGSPAAAVSRRGNTPEGLLVLLDSAGDAPRVGAAGFHPLVLQLVGPGFGNSRAPHVWHARHYDRLPPVADTPRLYVPAVVGAHLGGHGHVQFAGQPGALGG